MKITEYQKMCSIIGDSIPIHFRVVPKSLFMVLEVKLEASEYMLAWSPVTDVKNKVKRYKSYNAIVFDICRMKNKEDGEIESVKMEVNFRKIV